MEILVYVIKCSRIDAKKLMKFSSREFHFARRAIHLASVTLTSNRAANAENAFCLFLKRQITHKLN
jgi:hypothetical protein